MRFFFQKIFKTLESFGFFLPILNFEGSAASLSAMIGLFDSRPAYLPSVISTRAILKSGPGSGRTGNQINLQVWDIIQAPAGERIFLSC